MRKIIASLTACTLAAMTLLHSTASPADDGRWFRVEVLVFANPPPPAPGGAAIPEQWDPTPALSYPGAARFLVDPARVQQLRAGFQGASLLDDYGRLIITLTAAAQAPARQESVPVDIPVRPSPVYSAEAGPATNPVTTAAQDPAAADTPATAAPGHSLPRPFVLLPGSYQELRGKAALMQRGGQYPTLFHQAWVQPVAGEESSLPIVLDYSGDTGQWPRLQGSIKIYLSRYLHVETNLWFNTAGEYLPGNWRMPAPPLGPPSLIVEEIEPVYISAPTGELAAAAPAAAVGAEDGMAVPGEAPASGEAVESADIAALPPAPVYPYRHAVLLQQQRRMRSNEVHYIDHPLLGMLVKFTPVTGEELAAIAAAQATSLRGIQ